MTQNHDAESSDLPNDDTREAATLRSLTETPESPLVIPPLPEPPPERPYQPPPRPNPWDLLGFW